MSKYRIDGVVVDTKNAKATYHEKKFFDGHNYISVNTNDQWEHQRLHLSAKDRWYLESWADCRGNEGSAVFISDEEAVKWLIFNDKEWPEHLQHLVEACVE